MTRWINYYEHSLSQKVIPQVKETLLAGAEAINEQTSPIKKAEWAGQAMMRLEASIAEPMRRKILEDCGRQCIGASVLDKATRLKRASHSLEIFLEGLNQSRIGGERLVYAGGVIHAAYDRCYCGMVSHGHEAMSSTYCNCSRGWFIKLFETVLNVPVRVELVQSIIQGAEDCRFRISLPPGFEWQK